MTNNNETLTIKQVELEDGASANILQENVEHLKKIFPEAFTENGVDFEVLRQLLGDTKVLDEGQEKYGLNWHGKKKARQMALTPSRGTLLPCPEESVDWETTQNLFIEGDNLEVLKLLQKSYANKVKMIYIDPPYNTGKEFIYPDKFQDNLNTYLKYTGQVDPDGMKFSSDTETNGRKHTKWLNMMYPRLKLARNLLRQDGVIFISIDDNEQANLKKLCDEIFGEENFLGCAGRITKKSNNKGDFWAPNFDYLLTYGRSIQSTKKFFGGVNYNAYDLTEEDGPRKGEKYQLVRMYMSSLQNRNPEQRFFITCPDGSKVIPPGSTLPPERPKLGDGIWRWTRSKMKKEADKIVIKEVKSSNLIKEDGTPTKWNVYTKTYLSDVIANASAKPNSLVEEHINQIGSHEINNLDIPFDFSKPSSLIQYLVEISGSDEDAIILDFFAGSGTTAQAVMNSNVKDNGNRKYILVQLPETIDEKLDAYSKGYKNIAEIGEERIRRSAKKIKDENPDYEGDLGFKVFKLSSSNIKIWNPNRNDLERSLLDYMEHLVEGRSEQDILYELLLKRGVDLTTPIETREIAGKNVYSIGYGKIITCLDDSIAGDDVRSLAVGIVEWQKELKDNLDIKILESHVFFKDSAFDDDVVKTNIAATLYQNGIGHVRSL